MMKAALVVLLLVALVAAAPLLHSDSPNVIHGSYIVVLHEHLEKTDRDAHVITLQDQIRETGASARIGNSFHIGTLIGFNAELTEDLLKEQLAHPNVKYIEADQVMSINYKQEERAPQAIITQTGATWGISRVSQKSWVSGSTTGNYLYSSTAKGINVFVIDTGILCTHQQFTGRCSNAANYITGEANTDLNGHGTHCAGTIAGSTYGIAKEASLFAVKVLSASGSGSTTGVISGVNYVYTASGAANTKVASMSLGGGASTTLDQAVTNSIANGISYAIAAGNDNANACNYSPARVANAVTVGATTNADARSSFSNYGTCVDLFAPGSNILSSWIGSSNTATNTISGTSMATPHVAGGLALLLAGAPANPAPANIKSTLLSGATQNAITNPGTGSPNLLLFTNPQ